MLLRFLAAPVVVFALATWLWGGPASTRALHKLYQDGIDAGPLQLEVEGVLEHRRVVLPFIQYYDTQGLFGGGRPMGCPSQRSIVVWYGVGATVVWQEWHLWPTGRERRDPQ